MSQEIQLLDQFRKLCEKAVTALEQSQPKPPIDTFQRFITSATPILLNSVLGRLSVIREALECLHPWLLGKPHDLFAVVRLTSDENAYTELIAWAINPETNPTIAPVCQRAWLRCLGIEHPESLNPIAPLTQLVTDDGIPDLVLPFSELLVIVEAKTGTDEHLTPNSNQPQTIAYASAVRRRMAKPESFPTKTVFLTADRSDAANAAAIRTSYFEFAVTLARTLNDLSVPVVDPVKTLYQLIVNHFATRTADFGVNIDELHYLIESEHPQSNLVIEHIATLTHMLHLLPERTKE